MATYILGHKKPDLDSVVSAICLSLYKQSRGEEATAAITEDINNETKFVLDQIGYTAPAILSAASINSEDKIILVDHNEADQRLEGLNPDQITEIVDHHKVNLNLTSPIAITIIPWGSTATVIWDLYTKNGATIDKTVAFLLLSAILSDTVGLRSATTTDKDREAASSLTKLSGIEDIEAYTFSLFKAKSDINSLSPDEIVKNDYKVFDFSKKTLISQIETVEQALVLETRKEELLKALQDIKKTEGVELIFLAVSDILNINTKLLILSEAERQVAEKAFAAVTSDGVIDIGPKLSRKKEIAPPIESVVNSL
jgi:manganese-dependent inorganic pyrophosphatase